MSNRKDSITTQPPNDRMDKMQEHINILYELISVLEEKVNNLENKINVVLTPSETKTPERILETPPPPAPLQRNNYFSNERLPSADDNLTDFYRAQEFELGGFV